MLKFIFHEDRHDFVNRYHINIRRISRVNYYESVYLDCEIMTKMKDLKLYCHRFSSFHYCGCFTQQDNKSVKIYTEITLSYRRYREVC